MNIVVSERIKGSSSNATPAIANISERKNAVFLEKLPDDTPLFGEFDPTFSSRTFDRSSSTSDVETAYESESDSPDDEEDDEPDFR